MRYQSFNRSCAYAGLANMLEDYGIGIEDREIAKEAAIPYQLRYDAKKDLYLAGASLQGKSWFDRYLRKVGLECDEDELDRDRVVGLFDAVGSKRMIGIRYGNTGRHAVVFVGKKTGKYLLLNNRRADSDEEGFFEFCEAELRERLDEASLVTAIMPRGSDGDGVETDPYPETLATITKYREAILSELSKLRGVEEMAYAKDHVFRAMLLDMHAMMGIIGEKGLAARIESARSCYLKALASDGAQRLCDHVPPLELDGILTDYLAIVKREASR